MKKRINNLFFVIGVAAIVVMLFTFDVSFAQLWGYIEKAGYWLLGILILWFFLYMMNALAWRTIIKGSGVCPMSFTTLLKFTITGFALNYATPIGLLGGEAYKIMNASQFIDVRRATSSVVLFSMMHIFSHFWFWLTAVVVYMLLAWKGFLVLNIPLFLLLTLTFVFCGGGIYLFVKGYKYGLVAKLLRFISRIPGFRKWGRRFLEQHQDDLLKIDKQISELQSQNKRSFYASFFLEYFGRILQSLEIFFMLVLFGVNMGDGLGGYMLAFLYSFLILAFTSLFANLLGFLPMQLGGREGGFAISVVQLGMTGGIAMFVGIILSPDNIKWKPDNSMTKRL